ncbi:MAG: amidohydrolase [Rhodobacteraceae bacterium]|nr:amidohydrolase [Paracoccaceae bacterium]MBR9820097.1 amidohydrolase [Paracoccaceae bacterium]
MSNQHPIWRHADRNAPVFTDLADRIWDSPELNFEERRAAALHATTLEEADFAVTRGIAGMPTALMAEAGEDGPVIAILGEYDALPGLSQVAGRTEPAPLQAGGHGHGCGHNLLGAASALAAVAVRDWLAETGTPGRVRYYGCPAEEGGSSKGFMVRAGVFEDVDAAICWHPAAFTGVNTPYSLACAELEFTFSGRASHAAATPELGRSALDAMELMHIGVNYLREHMPRSARIHYAVIDGGGPAPNVVQSRAVSRQLVRAETLDELWPLVERVRDIARGAALMTGTTVSAQQVAGDANLVGNLPLEEAFFKILSDLGGVPFDAQDHATAAGFVKSCAPEDIAAAWTRFGLAPDPQLALYDGVYPLGSGGRQSVGSTDVGTVSWVVPTVQARVATYAIGTPGHSWQLVAQGKLPAAHKGMVHAAKAMGVLAARLLSDEALLSRAQAAHTAFRADHPFRNPISDEVELPRMEAAE